MHRAHRRLSDRICIAFVRFGFPLLCWIFITHATGLWGR